MTRFHPTTIVLALWLYLTPGLAQVPAKAINITIQKIVETVSEERITAHMRKLESFQTRNTLSNPKDPNHGVQAARRWLHDEFRGYSPRLQVRLDSFKIRKQGEATAGFATPLLRGATVVNVVAVLPGASDPDRQILVSAHYDTLRIARRPAAGSEAASLDQPESDAPRSSPDLPAPGVNDDGSGVAAVLELARVMSHYEFDTTIIFVAFDAEEHGLVGSNLYATSARREKQRVEAVLNNDIIGSEAAGDGRTDSRRVRVFSEEPADSPSRNLARYIKEIGERYVPSMTVDLIFRHDRLGRGGDHTSFNQEGFAAVRFTSAAEYYAHQHSATDTLANASPAYTTRVARVNAAALASLALAPQAPNVSRPGRPGSNRGRPGANIARGRSGYAAHLRWNNEKPETDLAGYKVVMRSTRAPFWEREIFVGNVLEYVMEGVSIDDVVFGVRAVDKDGNESLVASYTAAPFPKRTIEIE